MVAGMKVKVQFVCWYQLKTQFGRFFLQGSLEPVVMDVQQTLAGRPPSARVDGEKLFIFWGFER
jgi:hypothetical protein